MPSTGAPGSATLSVALDATPLLGTRTGVAEFCSGALGALSEREELSVSAFAVSWRRRQELPAQLPPGVPSRQRSMPARPLHWAWSHSRFPPLEWFVGRVDLVHGTNYVVPPTSHSARVVTVHDLTSVRFPEMCDAASLAFPRLVRRAVATGAWVHTPSSFVAEEVVAELGVDRARVRAVHHGVPGSAPDGCGGEDDDGLPEELSSRFPQGLSRFVLALGTVEPRKDYPLLVRAFDAVASEVADVALVIAGADGWGSACASLEAALDSARHRSRILRTGYVEPKTRRTLLRRAAVVAYPSVYEGFGFVPLEAMAAGTPVVATAGGAVPEIVGQAAQLVAPGDADALATALVGMLQDERLRARLTEQGRERATLFTWSACAEGLAHLYAEATP